jgi:hypothetical protein
MVAIREIYRLYLYGLTEEELEENLESILKGKKKKKKKNFQG